MMPMTSSEILFTSASGTRYCAETAVAKTEKQAAQHLLEVFGQITLRWHARNAAAEGVLQDHAHQKWCHDDVGHGLVVDRAELPARSRSMPCAITASS